MSSILDRFYKDCIQVENPSDTQHNKDGSKKYEAAVYGRAIEILMTEDMKTIFGDVKSKTIFSIIDVPVIKQGAKLTICDSEYTVKKVHKTKNIHGKLHSWRCAV